MGRYYYVFLLSFLMCILSFHTIIVRSEESRESSNVETYIVHVDVPSSIPILSNNLQTWYQTFLSAISVTSTNKPQIIYSFKNVFYGFSATLSPEQAKQMEKLPGFISARPQEIFSLHTTHSPNFLGLNQNMGFWNESNYGRGIIIGLLDSGVTQDHPSFSDEDVPPPPAKWKGKCEFINSTLCNNKIIGARSFSVGNGTPFDEEGHGTHTASTAAGNFVRDASVNGNGNGTAAGVAPLAHLAIYKVCGPAAEGCPESSVLAGMDAAIDDGVDVISFSISSKDLNFYRSITAGAFSAIERGIFVSVSAGNRGPTLGTVSSGAPWLLTVGASSIDRKIVATAVLGNKQELNGESAYQPADFDSSRLLPLIYPGMISNNSDASYCTPKSLSNVDVRGSIVFCKEGLIGRVDKGVAVKNAGGAAMILTNREPEGYTTRSDAHVLPATHLSFADGEKVTTYIKSTTNPMATILFKGTIIGDKRAPDVADFSSRGPNVPSPGILKPDIIGPGTNILAAWPVSVETNALSTKANFNIISGTSMSCPHLSGIAALLKHSHPNWSPAAIKSAIMTTADQVNLAGNRIEDQNLKPASVLATGSGHVNILKANDPGLIYDLQPQDYLPYLCGLNYTDQQVGIIVNSVVNCSKIPHIKETELNYPSFSVFLHGTSSQVYNRAVTNVGDANSVYNVQVTGLAGAEVKVEPSTLKFTETNQKLTYQVKFKRLANASNGTMVEGFLTWTSAKHTVTSPMVVSFYGSSGAAGFKSIPILVYLFSFLFLLLAY